MRHAERAQRCGINFTFAANRGEKKKLFAVNYLEKRWENECHVFITHFLHPDYQIKEKSKVYSTLQNYYPAKNRGKV